MSIHKSYVQISLSVLLALFVWGCGGSANAPKKVAEDFLKAVSKGDFEGAKQFATRSSATMLNSLGQATKIAESAGAMGGGNRFAAEKVEDYAGRGGRRKGEGLF